MITASLWVPRGAPAAFPTIYNVDKDELARISKLANLRLEDAKDDRDDFQHVQNGAREESDGEDSEMEVPGAMVAVSQGCVQVSGIVVLPNRNLQRRRR